jgi:hypothetical protein
MAAALLSLRQQRADNQKQQQPKKKKEKEEEQEQQQEQEQEQEEEEEQEQEQDKAEVSAILRRLKAVTRRFTAGGNPRNRVSRANARCLASLCDGGLPGATACRRELLRFKAEAVVLDTEPWTQSHRPWKAEEVAAQPPPAAACHQAFVELQITVDKHSQVCIPCPTTTTSLKEYMHHVSNGLTMYPLSDPFYLFIGAGAERGRTMRGRR